MRAPVLLLFLLLTLGLYAQVPSSVSRSDRRYSAEEVRRYEQLARQVTIIRDKWGIPHIYGKTDAAAVFGLLYVECQEDFARVERNYLEMLGRRAEVLGENYLYTDLMMQMIYDTTAAIRDYEQSPPWMHQLLDAFADGINYYLFKHPDCHPQVLQKWQPWYALLFTDGSVSATSLGGITIGEIKDFYGTPPATGKAQPGGDGFLAEVKRAEAGAMAGSAKAAGQAEGPGSEDTERDWGSNGFAIGPQRSASGNALLYINPHVPFYFRMEVQVVSEEGLNAYGAVTWGQFFVYQGFNAHCGWMHTSSYADVADVYEEKMRVSQGNLVYTYEGKDRIVQNRGLSIRYRKDNGDMAVLQRLVYYTHHGPVLARRNGRWLSLREYNRSLQALEEAWLITKAGDFSAFKSAMDLRANTTNNTVYADDQGNIAYWHGNFMPRRDTAYDWSRPVDGTVAATDWKGLHSLDELVHVYNPASGWIQNCNSTPFAAAGKSSPRREQYPAYMAPDGQNFRALNAIRLFSGGGKLTLDSLMRDGYDRYLSAFDTLLPALFAALPALADREKALFAEPVELLKQWDRRSAEHSIATTLAIEWATLVLRNAPRPATMEAASDAVGNLRWDIDSLKGERLLGFLAYAMDDLKERYGDWKVEWGTINRYQRLTGKIEETYSDDRPSLPCGLASSSFGALPSFVSRVMPETRKRYGYSGNSFIAAVEFGKRLTARSLVTGGESSDPASAHFADQAKMYLNGEFKPVLFYKEDVLKLMERQYRPGAE